MNTAELPKALARKSRTDAAAIQTLLEAINNVLADSRDYKFLSLIGTKCVTLCMYKTRKRIKKYKSQIQ